MYAGAQHVLHAGLPPDPELMSQALACRSAELAVETDELSRHIAALQRAHLQHAMAHAGLQSGGAGSGGAPLVYQQVSKQAKHAFIHSM